MNPLSMAYNTKIVMTPVRVNPYGTLSELRAATAALVASATVINTRAQATTPALTQQQQQDIGDAIAAATQLLENTKKYLGV